MDDSLKFMEKIFPDIEPLLFSLDKIFQEIMKNNQDKTKLIKIVEMLKKTGIEFIDKIPDDYFNEEERKMLLNQPAEKLDELFHSDVFIEETDKKIIEMVIAARESISTIGKIGSKSIRIENFYHKDNHEKSLSLIEIILSSLHDIGMCAVQQRFDNIAVHVLITIQKISNNTLFDINDYEFYKIEEICMGAISYNLESTLEECANILQGIASNALDTGNDTLLKKIFSLYKKIGINAIEKNMDKKMKIFDYMKGFFLRVSFKGFNNEIFLSYDTFIKLAKENNLNEIIYMIREHLDEIRFEAEKENNIIVTRKIDNLLNKYKILNL